MDRSTSRGSRTDTSRQSLPTLAREPSHQFRLDGGDYLYPDPESRFQPDGPHGPSQVIDPAAYEWHDSAWRGVQPQGQIVYELHIGTFTREGTFAAAEAQLADG